MNTNPVVVNEVRRSFYLDSVALMRISADLAALPGVEDAVAMIGTPANVEIMREAGLLAPEGEAAGPNDLVVAVRASGEAAAEDALARAGDALERKRAPAEGGQWRPRTLDGALDRMADANLVVVSTPGACAAREARRALDRGLNVMLFSDNVPLESERALKERAHAHGLLVMGPDCGTAYVAGTPLVFANVVPRGRIGVVAASGTGLQEVAVLLARTGAGISHGIGVGGRDLSDAVGGISTLDAIDLLASDAGTDHLILVSKPPGPRTARLVFERLAAAGKPCTAVVFGAGEGEVGMPPTATAPPAAALPAAATPPVAATPPTAAAQPAAAAPPVAATPPATAAPPADRLEPSADPDPDPQGRWAAAPPVGPVLAPTLKAAVERATGCAIAPDYDLDAVARRAAARLEPERHALRGLFCGGTLATEAHAVLAAAGLAVDSNTSNAAPSAKPGPDEPGPGIPPREGGPGIPLRKGGPGSPPRAGTVNPDLPRPERGQGSPLRHGADEPDLPRHGSGSPRHEPGIPRHESGSPQHEPGSPQHEPDSPQHEPGGPRHESGRVSYARPGMNESDVPRHEAEQVSSAGAGPARPGEPGVPRHDAGAARSVHTVIDLGADEYTVGRPHPMIDPALRTAKLREALAEPEVAVVLLDVVLGLGAHDDPARPVCDAVPEAGGPAVVASVCGTRDDPQDYERQAAMLADAGVIVAPSNADAAALAAAILGRGPRSGPTDRRGRRRPI